MVGQAIKRQKSTALRAVLSEYIQTSTVAGLHFAFDRTQSKLGQVLWLAIIIILTASGIYTSVVSYFDWENNPVVTTISSTGTPVTNVPFPSVIICSDGYNLENFGSAVWMIVFEWLLEGQYLSEINISPIRMEKFTNSNRTMNVTSKEQETLKKLDSFFGNDFNSTIVKKILGQEVDALTLFGLISMQLVGNPYSAIFSHGKEINEIVNIAIDNALREQEYAKINATVEFQRRLFSSFWGEQIYKMFMKLLWFTNMPCSDILNVTSEISGEKSVIKSCKWKGQPISCAAIFKKVTTDVGICCAFNRESADKIYVESAFSRVLKELEDFENKNSFESSALPDWYLNDNEPNTQAGNQMGLSLVLDSHSDLISNFSIISDFQSFTVAVIPPHEFPMMSLRGFQVKPGYKNQVSLSAIKVNSSDDIRSISPIKRNCYFPEETKAMKRFKKYSQTNCLLECKLRYSERTIVQRIENKSLCTPWNFPFVNNSSRMCDPWDKSKILSTMANEVPALACSYCLPDCNQFLYQTVVTTSKFRGCNMLNLGMTDHCSLYSLGTIHYRTNHNLNLTSVAFGPNHYEKLSPFG